MSDESIEEFLLSNGYKKYPPFEKYACASFQKTISDSEGKRFISINQYDMRDFLSYPSSNIITYDIGATFRTCLDEIWFNCKFYSIDDGKLRAYIHLFENHIEEVFYKTGGKKD